MKAIFRCLLFAIIFALSSCSTTEEIWINKDNTIKREVKMDMSAMAPFLQMSDAFKDAEGGGEEDDYNSNDEMDKEVEQGGEEAEAEEENDGPDWMTELFKRQYVDTLIDFKSMMMDQMKKEGITEEQFWQGLAESDNSDMTDEQEKAMVDLMTSLMDSKMRIKVDQPNNVYFFSMIQDFENADELNVGANLMKGLSSMMGDMPGGAAGDNAEQEMMMKLMSGGNPEYKLTSKELSITRPPLDLSELPEDIKSTVQMMSAFMGGMEYKYVIHVPKKVKKINVEGAVIKGNTVTFEVPLPDVGGGKDEGLDVIMKYK